MSLGTLGAVIKFALDLENKALAFYEQNEGIDQLKKKILEYQKRIKRLKRLRREKTTEMILEPIKDFFGLPYDFSIESNIFENDEMIISFSQSLETNLAHFYEEAAKKVEFLTEVAYIFKELAKQHSS